MPSVNPLDKNEAEKNIKNLPREQKLAVIFLAIIAISVPVFWALKLNTQLNKPFETQNKTKVIASSTVTDLHLKDSDGDGLSDYDEINVYHTSPYLEDSDSDNVNDKQEIVQGTDPNCSTGKNCNAPTLTIPEEASTTETFNTELPIVSDEASIVPGLGNEVTPDTLRKILLQNGYDAATLEKISDDDIMRSYQEAIAQSRASSSNQGINNQ